jgi:hypothetical protein
MQKTFVFFFWILKYFTANVCILCTWNIFTESLFWTFTCSYSWSRFFFSFPSVLFSFSSFLSTPSCIPWLNVTLSSQIHIWKVYNLLFITTHFLFWSPIPPGGENLNFFYRMLLFSLGLCLSLLGLDKKL